MPRTPQIVLVLLAVGLAGFAQDGRRVVVCPIEGMIDDGVAVVVKRAVSEAEGASAMIFVVDTPGGLLDSGIEITKTISNAPCHTIAYIRGMGAISAGALISYACDDLIMAPDTNIGAATPILISVEGPMPTSEKEVSFMRGKMRAMAESHGHNPAIAEAMVDKDIELRIWRAANGDPIVVASDRGPQEAPDETGDARPRDVAKVVSDALDLLPPELDSVKRAIEDRFGIEESVPAPPETEPPPAEAQGEGAVILAKGKLLTLTAKESLDYGLVPATADSVEEVLAFFGYEGAAIHEIVPTWSEDVFRFLAGPLVSGLLLMLGIAGLYMEVKTPGFGIFGVIGLACLALFFGSHLIIGLANWVDLLLVLVGVGLLAVEVLVIPGFGAAGIAGIACLMMGVYLSLTRVTIPRFSWDFHRLEAAGMSILVALLGEAILVYFTWKLLPHTPLYAWLTLSHAQTQEAGYVVQTAEQAEAAVGMRGVAASLLRPAGRGRFADKTLSVVSRGAYIEQGTAIVIVQAEGNRFVVEAIEGKREGEAQ